MTNDERKKKIVKIISQTWEESVPCTAERKFERIADALIAAGIGDVKEAEIERKAYEVASNHYRIQYEEQKDRAEVAERALRDRATYCVMEGMDYFSLTSVAIEARAKELYKSWRREAEKELAEEAK